MNGLKLGKWMLALAFAGALSACGNGNGGDGDKTAGTPSGSSTGSPDTQIYQYNLQDQRMGCTTGQHTFGTPSALCQALREDSQNRFCARVARYEYFRENCRNMDWNPRDGHRHRDRR